MHVFLVYEVGILFNAFYKLQFDVKSTLDTSYYKMSINCSAVSELFGVFCRLPI